MKISDISLDKVDAISRKFLPALREFGYENLTFESVASAVKAVIEGVDSQSNVIHVLVRSELQRSVDLANKV